VSVAPSHGKPFVAEQFRNVAERNAHLPQAGCVAVPEVVPDEIFNPGCPHGRNEPVGVDVQRLKNTSRGHVRPVSAKSLREHNSRADWKPWDFRSGDTVIPALGLGSGFD
jgi:hypothetical protein